MARPAPGWISPWALYDEANDRFTIEDNATPRWILVRPATGEDGRILVSPQNETIAATEDHSSGIVRGSFVYNDYGTLVSSQEYKAFYARYNVRSTTPSNPVAEVTGIEGVAASYIADEALTFRGGYFRTYIDASATATMRTAVGCEMSARASYSGGTECVAESGTAFVGARIWMAPFFTDASITNINNFHALWILNEAAGKFVTNAIKIDATTYDSGFTYSFNADSGKFRLALDGSEAGSGLVAGETLTASGDDWLYLQADDYRTLTADQTYRAAYFRNNYRATTPSNPVFEFTGVEGVAGSYTTEEAGTFRGGYFRTYINADATSTMRTAVGCEMSARASQSGGTECVAESGTAFVGARIWMAPYFSSGSVDNVNNFWGLWIAGEHATQRNADAALYISDAGGGFTDSIRIAKGGWSGSDADINIIKLVVTGTPVISWDESEDSFAFTHSIVPATSDGAALGTITLMWSDVFLASGGVINFNNGNQTITHDNSTITLTITGKLAFGGDTDWGTGATGTEITGAGFDWVTQTVGRVNTDINNTAAAAAYHALTVTVNQANSNSFFGTWTELYVSNSVDLTGADNLAAVWGQLEAGTDVTLSDTGCFTTGGYFNVKAGATLTVAAGHSVNGVRAQFEVSAISNSGRTAAFECLKSGGVNWQYGLYMADVDIGIGFGETMTPDATRTNIAISIGSRVTEKDITMAAANDQNLDPIQINLNIIGANPTNTSTVNAIYQKITHDTTAMANIRIKAADWNVLIGANATDAYVYQGELDITAACTLSGEGICMSALVDLQADVTADRICAFQAMITGSGAAGVVTGDCFVAYIVNAGTVITTDSILNVRNQSAATAIGAIELELDGTVTYAFDFQGTVSDGWTSGDGAVVQANEYVKIPVRVAGVTPTLYILAAETWA